MIKGIIFDVDNTLIDFYRMKNISISESIDAMIDAGLKIKKDKAFKIIHEIFNELGIEAHHIFQKFSLKVLGKVDHKIIAAAIVAHKLVWNSFLHTYPGVMETLIKLKQKNIKLGIVSDARKIHAYERLYGMRIVDFFDTIVAFDDTRKFKPAKRPFHHALKKLKLKPENCVMVGDWLKGDVGGAKKLGMVACLAKYGAPSNHDKKILSPSHLKKYKIKPDFILKEFRDIFDVVKKYST
ncbi:HAD-IA family hydrolase [Candidatus Woesearchaeota archaeon]|jgi:HAD superfamily hydrolase (TIGR02253 family)|nr:HAD-IA family hydrolase [Candidatus Woesearchaeota archaeon]